LFLIWTRAGVGDSQVSFRPTRVQAFGRGAYLGGLAGAAVGLLLVVLAAVFTPTAWLVALAFLVPVTTGGVMGGLSGLFFGRDVGSDVDDLGIYAIPGGVGSDASWRHVADVRTERRRGRTHVAVYLESGRVVRPPAPYDGRLLAGDAEFERKLFMLRNLWETHRTFAREHHEPPLEGV
jgi:hypothetical protein